MSQGRTANPDRPLRIAVVGTGLVGSTGALVLSRLKNVVIKAFERAPEPREAGAWISLSVSGLAILNRLVDPAQIRRIVYRPPDKAVYVARHWRTGQILARNYSSPGHAPDYIQARTHRFPLLQAILSNVPEGIIQYGYNVVDVVVTDDGVRLFFQDQPSQDFDLVVAADGIYSKIRQKYLPHHQVGFKGVVAYRKIFPVSLVEGIPGLPDDSSAWRGNGEVVFLSRLGLGIYGIVIIKGEAPEHAATLHWERAIGSEGLERLREHYRGWDPLIGQVLRVIEDIDAYPLDSGPWLKKLIRDDRVAFVGDAAHPTAGAFGAGAAMGFCDTWALFRSLQVTYRERIGESPDASGDAGDHSSHGYNLPRALRIYNETRRHFLSRVEAQMTFDLRDAQYVAQAGEDEQEWIRRFMERHSPNQWLMEHDVETEFQKTLTAESHWTSQRDSPPLVSARL